MDPKSDNYGKVNHSFEPDQITISSQDQFRGSNDFTLVTDDGDKPSPLKTCFPKKAQTLCSGKTLRKRFPPVSWLPEYDLPSTAGDLIAGVTVGLTLIPQGLAYSSIAQLPAQYGLYSSLMGCFVYILFGSCKDVSMGPTAISALLTAQSVKNKGPQHVILLCFLTGLVQTLMGFFGLGFFVDFISGPVASGFVSAGALIVVASQLKDVLGIDVTGVTFVEIVKSVVSEIHNTNSWDTIFAIGCITILLSMRRLSTVKIRKFNKDGTAVSKTVIYGKTILWLLGISRSSILVITSGFIGYHYCQKGSPPFKVIGYVPPGLPTIQPPSFSYTQTKNGTTVTENFFEMVGDLGSGVIVVPLLGLLEDIAVCKVFAHGKTVDATQELLAIGLSNIANSFAQSFAGTGALARSAVNHASGVRTPLGGLYAGLLVIAALLFFTPYFYYIPKPTLAAVIIAAAIFMVEVRVVRPMWRAKKSDLVPGIATFAACLALPLQYGILIGVGINVITILYQAARPTITIEKLKTSGGVDYLLLTPDRCLIFPSVDYVRNLVNKQSIKQGIPVVIDCSYIYGADYTAANIIKILLQDFLSRQQPLFFYNPKPSVSSVFDGVSPKEFVVYYNHEDIDEMLSGWYMRRRQSAIDNNFNI